MGKRLVERDRRFVGLTEHGEAILPWAQQIVSALASMNQTVSATNAHLEGEVTLAAIPAALTYVGNFRAMHCSGAFPAFPSPSSPAPRAKSRPGYAHSRSMPA
jgi:hypothetical protein